MRATWVRAMSGVPVISITVLHVKSFSGSSLLIITLNFITILVVPFVYGKLVCNWNVFNFLISATNCTPSTSGVSVQLVPPCSMPLLNFMPVPSVVPSKPRPVAPPPSPRPPAPQLPTFLFLFANALRVHSPCATGRGLSASGLSASC